MLDQKEPKNQEWLIARPRTRSAPRALAQIWRFDLYAKEKQVVKEASDKNHQ